MCHSSVTYPKRECQKGAVAKSRRFVRTSQPQPTTTESSNNVSVSGSSTDELAIPPYFTVFTRRVMFAFEEMIDT